MGRTETDKDKTKTKQSATAVKDTPDTAAAGADDRDENTDAMLELAGVLESGSGQKQSSKRKSIDKSASTTASKRRACSPLDNLYPASGDSTDMSYGHDAMMFGPRGAGLGGMFGCPPFYPMGMPYAPYPGIFPEEWDEPELPEIGADDPEPEEETVEINTAEAEDEDDENLLLSYQARYADEVGPPVKQELAEFVNKVWRKGRDSETYKATMVKHPRPENIAAQKVEVNPEVPLKGLAKARDTKLKSVQAGTARAAVPITRIAEAVMSKKQVNRKEVLDLTVDALTLMANNNEVINQIRRDSLKSGMQPKFQTLAKVPAEEDTTKLLFGENLSERIKAASQGGKLGRRGSYNSFPGAMGRGRGRGYGAYAPGYAPYQPYGYYPMRGFGRGRPFLGRYPTCHVEQNYNLQKTYNDNMGINENVSVENCEKITNCPLTSCRPPASDIAVSEQGPSQGRCREDKNLEDVIVNTNEVGEYEADMQELNLDHWGPEFKAGRVSACIDEWAKISSDYKILSGIRGYKLEFLEPPVQTRAMPEIKFSKQERDFVRKEIKELLQKEVIVQAEHTDGEFISNIFLREKQEKGKFRMILNLKHLNKYIEKQHFKMETFLQTLALITPGCRLISFDFSDAYYSCSVFPPHRKYLRFNFEGKLYEFTCLPNGLTSAPRFFTKIMKVAHSHLREKFGMTISGYLDDNILVNYDSLQEARREGEIAAQLLQKLGFTINKQKSAVWPAKKIAHLGFIINSEDMTVTMTEEKTGKIKSLVEQTLNEETHTIRHVARVIGKVSATRPANPWAFHLTKLLEFEKNRGLIKNRFNYEATMNTSVKAKEDLQWVLNNIHESTSPIHTPEVDYTIYTDASTKGWGCYDPQTGKKGGGRWTELEQELHINALELKAIWFGLRALCPQYEGQHIRIMTDNTTALACINKQGSVKSAACNTIARQIWEFAMNGQFWISAAHCPGVENVEADEASRVFDDRTEWMLRDDIFASIVTKFGNPSIDLFASRLNHKVDRYCAWQPDPGAECIDSFTKHWGSEPLIYAFPPFSIIHKVIQKVIREKARGIMVVPVWSTQPWFSLLNKITWEPPFKFHVVTDELLLPFSSVEKHREKESPIRRHPMAGKLTMMAVSFNGARFNDKGSHQAL